MSSGQKAEATYNSTIDIERGNIRKREGIGGEGRGKSTWQAKVLQ